MNTTAKTTGVGSVRRFPRFVGLLSWLLSYALLGIIVTRVRDLALIVDSNLTFPYAQRHESFMCLLVLASSSRVFWYLTLVPTLGCCLWKSIRAVVLSLGLTVFHFAYCVVLYVWFLESGYRYFHALVTGTPP